MRRSLRFMLVLAMACAEPAATNPPHVALPTPEPHAAPEARRIPDDPAAAYKLGFEWLHAGLTDDAMRAFREVIATLVRVNDPRRGRPPHAEAGLGSNAVVEGGVVVVETHGGVVLATATGPLDRFVEIPSAYDVQPVGGGLFAATTQDDVTLVAAATGVIVERVSHGQGVIRGKTLFAVHGTTDAGAFVDVWDLAARRRLRTLSDASLTGVMWAGFADDERALIARDGGNGIIWEVGSGAKMLGFVGPMGTSGTPAFSPDGRFIAYGTIDMDKTPIVGTTFLLDKATRKVLATSHVSQMPTGFAFAKDLLAIGDLRRACLVRVPQMSRVACSAEVRPHAGFDDDLQDAQPTFVGAHALAIETGDGSMLVCTLPTLATSWKGRARLGVAPNGAGFLVDEDNHELLSISPAGAVVHVRTLADFESLEQLPETHPNAKVERDAIERVSAAACHVAEWTFPAAACSIVR